MRALAVFVPAEKGEEIRRLLRDRGLLLAHLRVLRVKGGLLLAVSDDPDLGLPLRQADFPEGSSPVRSYKELIRVPEEVRAHLPASFDVIGDIAILKIPSELEDHRLEIGRAILAWNRSLRVVAQDRGVGGPRRVRRIDVIAGENRTTTIHVEFGLRYQVDVARAYFSPRLATERKRIADLVGAGETVADPFAGVGPYAILIGTRTRAGRVLASDDNPDAVSLLRANVAGNRAGRVTVRAADARDALRDGAPVDRVIMDLPHSALDFLPDAVRAVGPRGTVHLYGILGRAEREARSQEVRYVVEREGRRVTEMKLHTVRAYSPRQDHVAFDLTVDRA